MAAPTPVSSLVHSSTLVTAGIYLLFRFGSQVRGPRATLLLTLGLLTSTVAGIAALLEVDMKKIIALSTLRQLGVMATALGLSLPLVAFFHLLAHAFFKALIFMSIGSLIHNSRDFQDLRRVGASAVSCPFSIRVFALCNFALIGLPFTRGFFSKDLLIELSAYGGSTAALLGVVYLATALTASYSLRSAIIISRTRINKDPLQPLGDISAPLNKSNMILLPLAVRAGASLGPEVIVCAAGPALSWGTKTITLMVIFGGLAWSLVKASPAFLRVVKSGAHGLARIITLGVITCAPPARARL